jgi:hypothetical protein
MIPANNCAGVRFLAWMNLWEHHTRTGAKTHLAMEAAGFGERS